MINTEKDDVKYILGATDPMLGMSQRRESGEAKKTDVKRGTVRLAGMVEYFRTSQYLQAKAYLWWMQNYYTEDKFIRISGTGYGETDQEIELNKQAFGTIFNDITVGEYDVVLSYEGKTQTERERSLWRISEMAHSDQQNADIYNKWMIRLSDDPLKDKIIQEIEERAQMMAQERQMALQQNTPNRGGIKSAPRPGRGVRREPAEIR